MSLFPPNCSSEQGQTELQNCANQHHRQSSLKFRKDKVGGAWVNLCLHACSVLTASTIGRTSAAGEQYSLLACSWLHLLIYSLERGVSRTPSTTHNPLCALFLIPLKHSDIRLHCSLSEGHDNVRTGTGQPPFWPHLYHLVAVWAWSLHTYQMCTVIFPSQTHLRISEVWPHWCKPFVKFNTNTPSGWAFLAFLDIDKS